MSDKFSAVVRREGKKWIGWVEEIPGVNSQARTRAQLIENLRSALKAALESSQSEPHRKP